MIQRRPENLTPRPSFAQERLWFMDQLVPDTAAYTVPIALRVRGPVDVTRLQFALDTCCARHEPLRTTFSAGEDGSPRAVVHERVAVPLTLLEAGGDGAGSDEAGRVADARRLVTDFWERPFDLTEAPLIRAALIALGDDDHVLVIVMHHISSDGWSIGVCLADLMRAYRSGEAAAEPAVRYGDFALWQRESYTGARLDADLRFWRDQLADVAALELPADHPRPPEQRFEGAGHWLTLDADLTRDVLALSRRHGATPYMTFLAAYEALLARYSGQDDFAVGSTVAGRPLPELEGLIGLFANVLAVRCDVDGDPTFDELVQRVRDRVLDIFAHEETPFERIVGDLRPVRDLSRSPIFQATFTMLNYGQADLPDDGLAIEPFPLDTTETRFDLELYLYEPTAKGTDGFVTYNTDLFAQETIERLVNHFKILLRAAVAAPDTPVSRIDLLDPAERELLDRWNGTDLDIGPATTLHALVAAQVERTPDAVAVEFEGTTLTYRELARRANRLARRLQDSGVGPGTVVAVAAERSEHLPVGLLAVLTAGGAYLPLDPEYPPGRLNFMIKDAGARVLLAGRGPADRIGRVGGVEVIPLGAVGHATSAEDDVAPPSGVTPDDPAYVIYTSGSTGLPKGVVNAHRGIHNRLDWMQRTYRLDASDAVLQKTPAGFDVSVWELFWPLLAGARMVLARPGGQKDAAYLRDLIADTRVTTVHFVPSMLGLFLAEEGLDACSALRRVICSGEELPVAMARRFFELLDCELHNLYGPTEAAIDVTSWRCSPERLDALARVPIGRPIQNIRLHVLDGGGSLVPPGLPGELHIAGVGVALGYLGRPELTGERFRPDPFGPPGGRLYATGDLVRHGPDGTIDYLGRLDDQVKVRGLRIEPGEIEAALRGRPGVREAVVTVREDRPGDRRIVAYLLTDDPPDGDGDGGGPADDVAGLRAALRTTLPDYMVPAAFITLRALPLTPNGKLDRHALPAPAFDRSATDEYAAPRNDLDEIIAGVWAEILGIERVGIDDDFFALGGHSLLATQVVVRLRTALPDDVGRVSVMDLFKNPTVRGLSGLVALPEDSRGPRRLLHELTRPVPAQDRTLTYVCVPYGGGSAVVYQPLADALPDGYSLYSLALPGHDLGLDEEHEAFDTLVGDCVTEILDRVEGPLAVYGHCGVGGAVAVAVACGLEAAGRDVEAVYTGAIFPFARPKGRFALLRNKLERLRSDQAYINWLTSLGLDLADIDTAQVKKIVKSLRDDSEAAETWFTDYLNSSAERLRAPVVSVIGERDEMTAFYEERYREWLFLTDAAALVVLDEAGHYFLKYRAAELATIITTAHEAMADGEAAAALSRKSRGQDATWWLHGTTRGELVPEKTAGPAPSMARFLAIASGQLVSMTGSAMTEFAVPIWIYMNSGSLSRFALFFAVSLIPGLVVLPVAGAIVDRFSRRAVMLASDSAAGLVQAVFLALLLTDRLRVPHIYVLLIGLSVALTFQRLAYSSAVPQLVPKRYLGHANGIVQAGNGVGQVLVPLFAVGLMAQVGLGGVLIFDVVGYAVAITVVAVLRFPRLMAGKRRESLATEIATGFRYAMGTPQFRAMMLFFAVINLFLGPAFIMMQPLVLGFADLTVVTQVAVSGGLGVLSGGAVMAIWGGPARLKMRGVLATAFILALAICTTGLRPWTPLVAFGAFSMSLWLTIMNTIYATIVQVKVPQRFHGRVFSVQTLFAFCTLPIGFVVIGPGASGALTPLLREDGALAGSVGQLIGTGEGRGIGLAYVLFGLAVAAIVLASTRYGPLARFDSTVPDAEPDDVVGIAELRRRGAAIPGTAARPTAPHPATPRTTIHRDQ
jgi:amino acid adenylation domain-containing protein